MQRERAEGTEIDRMNGRLQFAKWLAALSFSAALAVSTFAQRPRANWQENRPPKQQAEKQQRQQAHQQQRQEKQAQREAQKNANRPPRSNPSKSHPGRPNGEGHSDSPNR